MLKATTIIHLEDSEVKPKVVIDCISNNTLSVLILDNYYMSGTKEQLEQIADTIYVAIGEKEMEKVKI